MEELACSVAEAGASAVAASTGAVASGQTFAISSGVNTRNREQTRQDSTDIGIG